MPRQADTLSFLAERPSTLVVYEEDGEALVDAAAAVVVDRRGAPEVLRQDTHAVAGSRRQQAMGCAWSDGAWGDGAWGRGAWGGGAAGRERLVVSP